MASAAARDHVDELERLDRLGFVRGPSRVHVEQWWDDPAAPPQRFGEALADWLLHGGPRTRSLCGRTILCRDATDSRVGRVSEFDDNDTCSACLHILRQLGHAHRAFEHPCPGASDD